MNQSTRPGAYHPSWNPTTEVDLSLRHRSEGTVRILFSLLALLFLAGCVAPNSGRGPSLNVKVLTERVGDKTRFLVRNSESTDMTATLDVGSVNMTASLPLPCTLTVPAGQTIEAVTLTPTPGVTNG